jgi:hypothetical protein
MANTFRTHTGEVVSGERLTKALNQVADDWARLARDIRAEDAYASHVDEATKERDLQTMLAEAEAIRGGRIASMSVAQSVNTALTGECIPLLGKAA